MEIDELPSYKKMLAYSYIPGIQPRNRMQKQPFLFFFLEKLLCLLSAYACFSIGTCMPFTHTKYKNKQGSICRSLEGADGTMIHYIHAHTLTYIHTPTI